MVIHEFVDIFLRKAEKKAILRRDEKLDHGSKPSPARPSSPKEKRRAA